MTVPWYLSSFDPQVPGVAPLTRAGTVVADANVAAVFDQAKAHGVGIEQE